MGFDFHHANGALQMEAQRDRSQNPKRQRKAQMLMKQEREKKQNDAFRNGRKAHWKAQDRSTRKRWRAQRRAAKRMSRGGGPESWHSGIFKSRHPIPWTKRAANKIGNLFKSKRKGESTKDASFRLPFYVVSKPRTRCLSLSLELKI